MHLEPPYSERIKNINVSVILQFERKMEVIRQDYVIVTLFLVFGIRLKPLRNIYQRNLQSNKYGLASSSPLFSVVLYSSQLKCIISYGSPKLPISRYCRFIDCPKNENFEKSIAPKGQRFLLYFEFFDSTKKNSPIASSY